MYAQNQDRYTYSSSPEEDDVNSVISSSLFDRIEAINGGKIGDTPAMLPTDGYLNSAAIAAAAVAPPVGPSSVGSSPSLTLLGKAAAMENQGYGQLQEQYGYNIPLKELPSLGMNCNDTRLSGGCGDDNAASIINIAMNGGEQQQQQPLNEELGRRQYQEVMSTPSLPTNEHQNNETSISIGESRFMSTSNNTTAVADSTVTPIIAGSSLLHANESKNKGSMKNVASVNNVAPTSADNNNDMNNNQEERPMIFNGKGSFPLNLALMLESVERPWDGCNEGKMNHIVSWLPCGSGFVIHDTELFLSEVLPRYFKSNKSTKIRSFYRKLNRWGFSVLRPSQLNKSGTTNSVKNAWHHSEFSRERAKECLALAQKSGDTDYSSILSVSHVHFRESSNGGGGGRKRSSSKRESDFSVESMDTSTRGDEFNYSLPSLERQVSLPNKRGGSFHSGSQRMSWTAGEMRNDYDLGSLAFNNAASQLGNQPLNQSWTTGSDLASHTSMNASQLTPNNFMMSWTAGMNINPMRNSSQPLNQSWTASSGFAPNNASQLSQIQLNQLMINQIPNNINGNDFYNEWKKMIMQGGSQTIGSSTFGQGQQQQAWCNGNSAPQEGTHSLQSVTNGNGFRSSSAQSELQQQWSQLQTQQCQMQEFGRVQQGQKQQPQNQGNEQESGPQNQGRGGGGGGGGEITQEDINLRTFFEKFAERNG